MIEVLQRLIEADYFKGVRENITIDNTNKSPTNIDNMSFRFDAMNSRYLGRVTLWQSGDINTEILDIKSMNTIDAQVNKVNGEKELIGFLTDFFRKMKKSTALRTDN